MLSLNTIEENQYLGSKIKIKRINELSYVLNDHDQHYLFILADRCSTLVVDNSKVPIAIIKKEGLGGRLLGRYKINVYLENNIYTINLIKGKLIKNPDYWYINLAKNAQPILNNQQQLLFKRENGIWKLYCEGMDLGVLLMDFNEDIISFHSLLDRSLRLALCFSAAFIALR